MRKVRYNDRLWFGKYKGSRVCDVLSDDPSYIQKIQKENNLVCDDKILARITPRKKDKILNEQRYGRITNEPNIVGNIGIDAGIQERGEMQNFSQNFLVFRGDHFLELMEKIKYNMKRILMNKPESIIISTSIIFITKFKELLNEEITMNLSVTLEKRERLDGTYVVCSATNESRENVLLYVERKI